MPQKHLIDKVTMEIGIKQSRLAFDYQNECSQLMQDELMPIIEDACDQYADPDRHIIIDKLEIDLGKLSAQNFRRELLDKFKVEFSLASLAGHRVTEQNQLAVQETFAEPPFSSRDEYYVDTASSRYAWMVIQHFLQCGRLPWFVDSQGYQGIERQLVELMGSDAGFKSLLTEVLQEPASLERLLCQLQETTLNDLYAWVFDKNINWIEFIDNTRKSVSAITSTLTLIPRIRLWEIIWKQSGETIDSVVTAIWQKIIENDSDKKQLIIEKLLQHQADFLTSGAMSRNDVERILKALRSGVDTPALDIPEPGESFKPQASDKKGSSETGAIKTSTPQEPVLQNTHPEPGQPPRKSVIPGYTGLENADVLQQNDDIQSAKTNSKDHSQLNDDAAQFTDQAESPAETATQTSQVGYPSDTKDAPFRGQSGVPENDDFQDVSTASEQHFAKSPVSDHKIGKTSRQPGDEGFERKAVKQKFAEYHHRMLNPEGSDSANLAASTSIASPRPIESAEVSKDRMLVSNAGVIIFWPYLQTFFQELGLLDGKLFKDIAAQEKSIHLLQYLAAGEQQAEEHALTLNKVLCNWPVEKPLHRFVTLTGQEIKEADTLVQSVIQNWSALGKTSPQNLRRSFILRNGLLKLEVNGWLLQIEKGPYDVLLDRIPWGLSVIKLPWMEQLLQVEW